MMNARPGLPRIICTLLLIALSVPSAVPGAALAAAAAVVDAKRWPLGFFFPYHQAPLRERDKVLQAIAARLDQLHAARQGLLVKGAILDPLRTDIPVYDQVRILDDSGLLIVVRRLPNLYYRFSGGPLNRNTYLVIKNPRVNYLDSYIKQNFVVEGDFFAYVQSYIDALRRQVGSPAPPAADRKP